MSIETKNEKLQNMQVKKNDSNKEIRKKNIILNIKH